MRSKGIIAASVIVILIIAVAGGYYLWQSGYFSQPAATPTPSATATPEATPTPSELPVFGGSSTQEQVRDEVMNYTEENHEETVQYLQGISWSGGDVTPSGIVGSSTYTYLSSGWNVTMQYPIVPDPIFTVTADYSSKGLSILWKGTWQNGTVTETSYTDNLLSTQAEMRDAAVAYMLSNHAEAAHLLTNLAWTGGAVYTGLVGSVLYEYTSTGWTMEIQNPVVPNPIYTITANYSSGASTVVWAGTLENRAITETSYTATNLTAQLSEQEQVRESVIAFLKAYRSESAEFMQGLVWAGGQTTPGGIVGSETYLYQGSGWTLEMQYPVVLNPIYTVSANYTGRGMYNIVAWQGTWQSGTILETSYAYTP